MRLNMMKSGVIPLFAIVATILLATPDRALAQGSVFGTVQNADLTVPPNGQITFFGFLDDTDEEIRIETSTGAGYDNGNWFDDFQNYLTEAPGNPYDYYFYNTTNSQGFQLAKLIPNNSFQQENFVLAPVSWPAQPSGIVGVTVSSSSVVLNWSATSGITYHIYRRAATSTGSFFRLDNVSGLLTDKGVVDSFFVDATVDGVSSYSYILIAEDVSGNYSPHSAVVTVNSAVISVPVLASITPASGVDVGGVAVDIFGSGFDIAGVNPTIGGAALTGVTVVSPFQISGITPAGALGVADVLVTNSASALASNTLVGGFTYTANTPPVLALIGAQSTTENVNLNFSVSSTDAESIPNVTTSALPGTATFTPDAFGGGVFDWTPTYTEAGIYSVTFYSTDAILVVDSEVVTITVIEAGNQPPVLAAIGPQSVVENATLNFSVSSTDIESTTTASTSTLPGTATFTPDLAGGGVFEWTPTYTDAGVYNVTFYSTDVDLGVDSEVVAITVTEAGNQLPVLAAIGPQSTAENANLNFAVSSTDAESTPDITTSTLPGTATFTPDLVGGGIFDWTPSFTDAGIYNVTFYSTDADLAVDSEVVIVTVTEVGNQLPVLVAIGPQLIDEGVNLNFSVSSTDAESIPDITTSTLPGTATFTPDLVGGGVFDWTPSFADAGIYSVTFYATDAALAVDSEVVTITVTEAGNQPPVLAAIGPQSIAEGANLNFGVSSTDAESTPTITTSTLPGTATFTPDVVGGGVFDWTPGFTEAGIYSVTFYTTDADLAVDSEVVTITVTEGGNQLPVLVAIGPQSIGENATLNFSVSSTDIESTPDITTSTLPGTATFTPDILGGGVFDWTPNFIDAGIYNVTFYATDAALAVDSEVVTITVTEAGNQLPALAIIGPQSIAEGVNLNFSVSSTDAESIPNVTTSTLPGTATFTPDVLGGGVFDWTPSFTDAGIYSVTFYTTDDSLAVDSEVVTITITESGNQPPVLAVIGPQSVVENANLNFAVSSTDAETSSSMTTGVLPGTSTFTPDAFGGGVFDWTPTFTDAGIYNVTFYATDTDLAVDSEVVVITVTDGGNQLPILAVIGSQVVDEGATLTLSLSATDIESIPTISGAPLPVGAVVFDSANGSASFSWTPDFTQAGIYNVTFFASDVDLGVDSEVVVITVNEATLAAIGSQTTTEETNLNFTVSSDIGSFIPVLTTSALPTGATFFDNADGTGSFDWTPTLLDAGVYSITFFASDGVVVVDSEIVSITVVEVGNSLPVLTAIGPQAVVEAASLLFVVSATDGESIPTLTTSTLPSGAIFVDSANGFGSFDWTPTPLQAGVYNVTFYATDDSLAVDSETVVITVSEGGNSLPVLAAIGDRIVAEGLNLNFNVSASDFESIPTLTTSALPVGAIFVDSANGAGNFDWTPGVTSAGIYSVTFYATDDSLVVDSEVVSITVSEIGNQSPIFTIINDTTILEGGVLELVVSATDPDGVLPPSLTVSTSLINSVFVDSGNGVGVFTYNPTFMDASVDTIRFFAIDDGVPAISSQMDVQVVTQEVNQPPLLAPIGPFGVLVGSTLNFTILASDSTDQDSLHRVLLSAVTPPVNSSFIDNQDNSGTFSFSPTVSQQGVDTVRFLAVDQGNPSLSTFMDVIISVVADNQEPILNPIGPQTVLEGNTLTVNVTATDPDGGVLQLSIRNAPANSGFVDNGNGAGVFTFTPDFTQGGGVGASKLYYVTFVAFDGIDDTRQQVYIQVYDAGNKAPEFVGTVDGSVTEGTALNYLITAIDPDGSIPTLSADSLPAGATFTDNGDGTGSIDFTPSFIQAGAYIIYITATDGVLSTTISVILTVVDAGNQLPVLPLDSIQIDSLEATLINFTITATDPDTTTPVMSATGLPFDATFIDNLDGSGTFNWQTQNLQTGVYTVIIFATDALDNQLFDSAIVIINLLDKNFPPVVLPDPFIQLQDVNEGDTLIYRVKATDPDSTFAILTLDTAVFIPNLVFIDSGNGVGVMIFTPDFSQGSPNPGTSYFASFVATDAVDDTLQTRWNSVQFKVFHVNRPPEIAALVSPITLTEGESVSFVVTASDPDDPNTTTFPILIAENVPANATANYVVGNLNTMVFKFFPDFTQAGTYTIRFIASDNLLTDTVLVQIDVLEAGNQNPVWMTTLSDTTVFISLVRTDLLMSSFDPDADSIFVTNSGIPLGAFLIDSSNGTALFSFTPTLLDVGLNLPVEFYINDTLGAVDTIQTVISVRQFLRGDANSDSRVDVTDIVFLMEYIFSDGQDPVSMDAADVNYDGHLGVGDVTYLSNYFFRNGAPPPQDGSTR